MTIEHIQFALAHKYNVWLLLDGYDEIVRYKMAEFSNELHRLLADFSNINIIITSRKHFEEVNLIYSAKLFSTYRLKGLNDKEIYNRLRTANFDIDLSKIYQQANLMRVLKNPLLLENFIQMYETKSNPYEYFSEQMQKYVVWRGHTKSNLPPEFDIEKIETLLEELAYYLTLSQREWLPTENLIDLIKKKINYDIDIHIIVDAIKSLEPIQFDENRFRFRHVSYRINYSIKKIMRLKNDVEIFNLTFGFLLATKSSKSIIEKLFSSYNMKDILISLSDKNITKLINEAPDKVSEIAQDDYPIDSPINFLKKIERDYKSKSLSRKDILVFAIHGFNTRGEWKNDLSLLLSLETDGERFLYQPWDYGVFVFQILDPFSRRKQIRKFQEFYNNILTHFDIKPEIVIVAHSFGTYIVGNSLKRFPEVSADRILLLGSVLKRGFPWRKLSNKYSKVLNILNGKDFALSLSKFILGLGDAGKKGFSDKLEKVIEINELFCEHSDIFGKEYMKTTWIPFIRDGSTK
jgi:hypothetical protein